MKQGSGGARESKGPVRRGKVADWEDDRGFGFIESEAGGERRFFHISQFEHRSGRPRAGDLVSYEEARATNGKLQAIRVRPAGDKLRAVRVKPAGGTALRSILSSKRVLLSIVALMVFPALWLLLTWGVVPIWLFWVTIAMSLFAVVLYGLDKWAAKRDRQRTPEATLQLCALLCGWPGALLAQQVFRHKSSKRAFQFKFWLMVALNVSALSFMSYPDAMLWFRQVFY
ncbi:MAG: cold shock and DUF1294 domain-containing protein [Xanthomonadales bacterium]|nr:cold shock and DUF1294 domain-containing protein [Xanthomonadales bacterium]